MNIQTNNKTHIKPINTTPHYTTCASVCTKIRRKFPTTDWNMGIFCSEAPIPLIHSSSFLTLTGETENQRITGSPTLIRNIQIAKLINEYVKSIFPMPANHALKSPYIRSLLAENKIEKANSIIIENFEVQSEIRTHTYDIRSLIDQGVGSCEEMTIAALLFAKETYLTDHIERARIENGDHHFLVIGRKTDSSSNDYTTWGENAVICDPWSGGYYPTSLLENNLKDYIGTQIDESGFLHCMVNPFNPTIHRLQILEDSPCQPPSFSEKSTASDEDTPPYNSKSKKER